jgi:tetratricopeptide (TPR) repeat protein
MIIGAILAVLLAGGSLNRLSSLASPITAWGDAIATLSEDPRAVGRWRPYLNRGEAYVDKGMPEQALRDFIAADAMGDVEGYGQFNRGIALYLLKKYPAAVDAFTLAEKKGFPEAHLFYQRGLALIAQGQLKEAHADFERALQRNIAPPLYWSALAQRGMLALDLGDAAAAVRDLEQALPNLQEGRLARTALGISLALTGQAERARDLLNDSLKQAASPPAFFGRALAFYTLRQKGEALADIEAALRLSPRSPRFEELRDKIRALP